MHRGKLKVRDYVGLDCRLDHSIRRIRGVGEGNAAAKSKPLRQSVSVHEAHPGRSMFDEIIVVGSSKLAPLGR